MRGQSMKIGFGYDSHRLIDGRKLFLGGVEIPHPQGLLGHSDADVLLHAVIDAIIGALGKGDIGKFFPDTDPAYKDAPSLPMLKQIVDLAKKQGCVVSSLDCTVLAEAPKIAPHIEAMKDAMASTGISRDAINIKGKTNEGMGMVGKGEGMAAFAVCLILNR